jgi:hypothetical protein
MTFHLAKVRIFCQSAKFRRREFRHREISFIHVFFLILLPARLCRLVRPRTYLVQEPVPLSFECINL